MVKRKIAAFAAIVFSLVILSASTVFAAEEYKYTVNVLDGGHGTITSGETAKSDYAYGDTWDPSTYSVEPESKYIFKGFHIAGQDQIISSSITVEKDMDIVATYGIAGKVIKYTVNYVGADGTNFGSATFYGNEGETPYVVYPYHENYEPKEGETFAPLSETSTVYNATYNRVEVGEGSTEEVVIDEGTTVIPGTPTTPGGGTTPAGGTTPGGETAPAGGEGEGETIEDNTTPEANPSGTDNNSGASGNGGQSDQNQGGQSGQNQGGQSGQNQGGQGGQNSGAESITEAPVPQANPTEAPNGNNNLRNGLFAVGGVAAVAAIGIGVAAVVTRKKRES